MTGLANQAHSKEIRRYLIQLAKAKGKYTLNIVRREELEKELADTGADLVMAGGENLPEKVMAEWGGASIP